MVADFLEDTIGKAERLVHKVEMGSKTETESQIVMRCYEKTVTYSFRKIRNTCHNYCYEKS